MGIQPNKIFPIFPFFNYIYVKLRRRPLMTKKIFSVSLLVAICTVAFFSCKKYEKSTADATRNYFPLQFGKYVTYAVDSVYYVDSLCVQFEVKSQMKYTITDTFHDKQKRLSYIMDVYSRPYDGAFWTPHSVIFLTPTATGLLYSQDNAQYEKLRFPINNEISWPGNQLVQWQYPQLAYLKNWNYRYLNTHLSYFNGFLNFDNTVTVLEDDESVNYPNVDSAVQAYRTYAKEVYAYNVGMIYKEWTHWTYSPPPGVDTARRCVSGYRVVMQAIDHN